MHSVLRANLRDFPVGTVSIYEYCISCLNIEVGEIRCSYIALLPVVPVMTFSSGYLYSLLLFYKWQKNISESLRNWLATSFQMEEVGLKSWSI